MKERKIYILIFVVLILLVGEILLFVAMKDNKSTIVYVDLKKLHSEFKLTQELEAKLKNSSDSRDNVLDSLKLGIEMLSRKLADAPTKQLEEKYRMFVADFAKLQEQYKSDNDFQSNQYDSQIWNQLNQSINDYRDSKGYDYILGTSGSGNIMSANSKLDVTTDLIEYSNKKYGGK